MIFSHSARIITLRIHLKKRRSPFLIPAAAAAQAARFAACCSGLLAAARKLRWLADSKSSNSTPFPIRIFSIDFVCVCAS